MEGCGKQVGLADKDWMVLAGGENLNIRSYTVDARGADEDHLERTSGKCGWLDEDRGVVLSAVGVALDGDVKGCEGLLRGARHMVREEDASGAGAEGGSLADKGAEGVEEAIPLQELEHGCGFSTGDDEAVKVVQMVWTTNETRIGSEREELSGVNVVCALQGKDADPKGHDTSAGR